MGKKGAGRERRQVLVAALRQLARADSYLVVVLEMGLQDKVAEQTLNSMRVEIEDLRLHLDSQAGEIDSQAGGRGEARSKGSQVADAG